MLHREWKLDKLIEVVYAAGEAVMGIYRQAHIDVQQKQDNTPLTRADCASQEIISQGLMRLFSEIPVISEESRQDVYETRKSWEYVWLVDPLDGTKEFINKNGEFTINVCLVRNNKPFLGLVLIPAQNLLYFAQQGLGAFKKDGDTEHQQIFAQNQEKSRLVVARSRSHSSPEEQDLIAALGDVEQIQAGSALKFCYVAEGKADIYVRSGRTMEWDTAAGQCIVESARGFVVNARGEALRYNKQELYNEGFVCFSGSSLVSSQMKTDLTEFLQKKAVH